MMPGLLWNTTCGVEVSCAHLVHSSIRSSISVDVGLPNLSEDSPVKSFVAEEEAASAITIVLRGRPNALFAASEGVQTLCLQRKHVLPLLLHPAGALRRKATEARILSEGLKRRA